MLENRENYGNLSDDSCLIESPTKSPTKGNLYNPLLKTDEFDSVMDLFQPSLMDEPDSSFSGVPSIWEVVDISSGDGFDQDDGLSDLLNYPLNDISVNDISEDKSNSSFLESQTRIEDSFDDIFPEPTFVGDDTNIPLTITEIVSQNYPSPTSRKKEEFQVKDSRMMKEQIDRKVIKRTKLKNKKKKKKKKKTMRKTIKRISLQDTPNFETAKKKKTTMKKKNRLMKRKRNEEDEIDDETTSLQIRRTKRRKIDHNETVTRPRRSDSNTVMFTPDFSPSQIISSTTYTTTATMKERKTSIELMTSHPSSSSVIQPPPPPPPRTSSDTPTSYQNKMIFFPPSMLMFFPPFLPQLPQQRPPPPPPPQKEEDVLYPGKPMNVGPVSRRRIRGLSLSYNSNSLLSRRRRRTTNQNHPEAKRRKEKGDQKKQVKKKKKNSNSLENGRKRSRRTRKLRVK